MRGLDFGFWEILKPLKWTNITSFFLINNGCKDITIQCMKITFLIVNIKPFLQWLLSSKGYQFAISRFSNAN
jgi:hypothetical protein